MMQVVAGVLHRDGKVLICRRREDQAHPLKWEFPGGKLEPGETPDVGLIRELREELGIDSQPGHEIARYEFSYAGEQSIELIFLKVERWAGEIGNRIFNTILWATPDSLCTWDFLEGDAPFVNALTAPQSRMERPGSDSTTS